MFTRLLTFIMVLAIFTVSASASTHDGLKAAFDELNYSLTVEWDQQDQKFYQEQMNGFQKTIKGLQEQGLTNAELVEFVKSEVKDQNVARDLETAFNMIALNKMSPVEASNYMVETMQRSYKKGASWNGAAGAVAGVVVVAVIVAVLIATGVAAKIGRTRCGYSSSNCGVTCSGFDCDDNYCCWN